MKIFNIHRKIVFREISLLKKYWQSNCISLASRNSAECGWQTSPNSWDLQDAQALRLISGSQQWRVLKKYTSRWASGSDTSGIWIYRCKGQWAMLHLLPRVSRNSHRNVTESYSTLDGKSLRTLYRFMICSNCDCNTLRPSCIWTFTIYQLRLFLHIDLFIHSNVKIFLIFLAKKFQQVFQIPNKKRFSFVKTLKIS